MITRIGRRVLELGIALFAVLGFVYVPLGKKTGFEHAKAVFTTPAAREAGRELFDATKRVKAKLVDTLTAPQKPMPNLRTALRACTERAER